MSYFSIKNSGAATAIALFMTASLPAAGFAQSTDATEDPAAAAQSPEASGAAKETEGAAATAEDSAEKTVKEGEAAAEGAAKEVESAAEGAAEETEQAAQEAEGEAERVADEAESAAEATEEAAEAAPEPVPGGMVVAEQPEGSMITSEIIGASVMNANGDSIGDISAIVFGETGIEAAVVGVGGFLGIGEKDVGIHWSELTRSDEGFTVNATQEQLEGAPSFLTVAEKTAEEEAERQRQEAEAAAQQSATGTAGTAGTATTEPAPKE